MEAGLRRIPHCPVRSEVSVLIKYKLTGVNLSENN
jgi:hypothetical protein